MHKGLVAATFVIFDAQFRLSSTLTMSHQNCPLSSAAISIDAAHDSSMILYAHNNSNNNDSNENVERDSALLSSVEKRKPAGKEQQKRRHTHKYSYTQISRAIRKKQSQSQRQEVKVWRKIVSN